MTPSERNEIVREWRDRQVSVGELREALERPLSDEEREEIQSLVRWFMRRYPTPSERLAYVRRAYARWAKFTADR